MRFQKTSTLFVSALLAVGLVACGGGGGGSDAPPVTADAERPADGDAVVRVVDNDFEPEHLEIPAGTTVTWTWEGGSAHDVVGDDFDSGILREGATFTHTFEDVGAHDYECTLHRGMVGRITVVAS